MVSSRRIIAGGVALMMAGGAVASAAQGEEREHADFSTPSPTFVFVQGGASTNNNAGSGQVLYIGPETYHPALPPEHLEPHDRTQIHPIEDTLPPSGNATHSTPSCPHSESSYARFLRLLRGCTGGGCNAEDPIPVSWQKFRSRRGT